MKTFFFLLTFCTLSALVFLPHLREKHDNDNTSIIISDSDDGYKLSATFNENKTKEIRHYIGEQLNNADFKNAGAEATIELNTDDTFSVKSTPGELKIALNKKANSAELYLKVKDMGQGIKRILERK